MTTTTTITASVTVPVAPDRAHRAFADELHAWWPPEYTWSQQALEWIGFEDGFAVERGPDGFTCHWGRVLEDEPAERLRFSWQIQPDRTPQPDAARASEVTVTFAREGEGTRVDLRHEHFDRHGDGAEGYAHGMGSPQGWPYLLERYAAHAAGA